MNDFPILDAALTGFGVVRRHPMAVLIWAGLQLAATLTLVVATVVMAGPAVMAFQNQGMRIFTDSSAILAFYSAMLPPYLIALPVIVALSAIQTTAMNRVVLRPGPDRFGFLQLGWAEARQLGLALLTGLLFGVAYFAAALIADLIGGVAMAVSRPLGLLVLVLLIAAIVCGFIVLAVRLSLASPLTFDKGRINLFGSWDLTRGRFWPLCGAYAIAVAMAALVLVLSLIITSAAAAVLGGVAALRQPDVSSLAAYMTPAQIIQIVLGSLAAALYTPLVLTPPAAIYQHITARAAPRLADTFA